MLAASILFHPLMQFERLSQALQKYYPNPDLDLLRRAFDFAFEQHKGQVRASGEPYFDHVFETALLACELKLDMSSVVAAILHDTVEDCAVTRADLEKHFGSEVADIVEGVTKLTRIEFESKEEQQAESFRKMLLAMAKDIRVILVKLCDRLHNMRTLQFKPETAQRTTARETADIYAPLANRLGIHWMKSELEDLCLKALRPEIYLLIQQSFDQTNQDRQQYIQDTCREIVQRLQQSGLSASVKGRVKHYYSIWQKMERDKLSFDEVYDILGFRIIVPTVRACYEALGTVHSAWKPVPGRFKDYIAMPKPNMYQSLHTTVIGPGGQRVEVQIRTPDMHQVAEEGIAAHWRYKETGKTPAFDLQWVKDLVDTQQYLKNPDEFIQSVKGELFPEEVFVFTPDGDLIRLSFGATPIDFAYAVHTDIGHRAVGARVNGTIVPLDYKLQNGDTVKIVTSKNHVPSKDWLRFVRSTKAKQRIRAFLKTEEHARSLAVGVEILSKELRKSKLNLKKLESSGKVLEVAQGFGLRTEGELYAAIGYGKISAPRALAKFVPEGLPIEEASSHSRTPLQRIFESAAKASQERAGVKVEGFDDILVRFARCCQPLPGDRIVGFITRGRGVSIHFADCPQVLRCDPLRRIEVSWDGDQKTARKVRVSVVSQDQIGLLANMTRAITDSGGNIISASINTTKLGKAMNVFEVGIADARHFDKMKRALEMVPGVIRVERLSALQPIPAEEEAS
jgi:guanosine-3',5'-bis(diphosphate) 3'-pyrophosphohydrolase